MNNITRLQKWYHAHCDRTWEHSYGVRIETLDNPGWLVKVNLQGTSLARKPFKTIAKNVPEEMVKQATGQVPLPFVAAEPQADEWMVCYLKDDRFEGSGDASRLDEILSAFLDWAEPI